MIRLWVRSTVTLSSHLNWPVKLWARAKSSPASAPRSHMPQHMCETWASSRKCGIPPNSILPATSPLSRSARSSDTNSSRLTSGTSRSTQLP